jgi:hypothetical protein
MKIFVFLLIFVNTTFAQLDDLNYLDLENPDIVKTIKRGQKFKSYTNKSGITFNLNDTLEIGNPENPQNVSKNLLGQIQYGNFTFITVTVIFETAQKFYSKEKVIINQIIVYKFGKSLRVIFEVNLLNKKEMMLPRLYIDNIDKAIELGEIIFDNGQMTKEKAIKLLKEKKELLDLGIITQEEYNKFKNELTPIILDNK